MSIKEKEKEKKILETSRYLSPLLCSFSQASWFVSGDDDSSGDGGGDDACNDDDGGGDSDGGCCGDDDSSEQMHDLQQADQLRKALPMLL